jgi:hypothetical protein
MVDASRKGNRVEEPPFPDKLVAVHETLAEAKIPHAFGGAIALAYYATPRATIDLDLNVFVAPERWRAVIDALAPLGIATGDVDPVALERDGQCRLWWGVNPVDLFFAYDALHTEMKSEARRVPFAGTTIPILAPEHLAVCKAMFDRAKDWLDLEQMLIATEGLNIESIEGWLRRMVGERDSRLERFGELRSALSLED